jgi:metallo-beta-lactamase class B
MSLSLSKRALLACLSAVLCSGAAVAQHAAAVCANCSEWNQPQTPFRIFANTYYVGTHALSSVLITSDAGHVLIDGDLPQSAREIVRNIRSLGFHIEDVKLIVNSHVHFDHAGGIAELQRRSGARVVASPWSAAVLQKGGVGRGDPQYGAIEPIAPVKNVSAFHDGENFHVGDITITAHLTAGHTPGGTSWTWKSCESDICRNMVYADSLTPVSAPGFQFTTSQEYPRALDDFEKSFTFFETTPCDILITAHPEFSALWDRLAARERGTKPDLMIDSTACRRYAASGREKLRQRLATEAKP